MFLIFFTDISDDQLFWQTARNFLLLSDYTSTWQTSIYLKRSLMWLAKRDTKIFQSLSKYQSLVVQTTDRQTCICHQHSHAPVKCPRISSPEIVSKSNSMTSFGIIQINTCMFSHVRAQSTVLSGRLIWNSVK